MKKHSPSVKSFIRKSVVSSCVLSMLATSPGWAQVDSQDGTIMFQQNGAQNVNGQSAAAAATAYMRRNGAGSLGGAGTMPSMIGQPVITNTQPGARGTRPQSTLHAQKGTNDDRNTFETYAEKVTGAKLDIFGKGLFNDVPDTFAPADGVQVNPDYIIGTGDELQIRGWGMVDLDVSARVDRSGAIYIPRVGSVKVAGVKYRDLQDYLKKAVGKIFTNFDLTASVSQTRAVQVYVVGHAVRPGTYTLSAMSTLLNALFTSGGPDSFGSMRNIQVKRGGVTVTSFDLYEMLVKGDKSRDVALQDGDVIYIPEVGPLVALTGNVKNPAIFELKGQASLADVITWAGGFDSAAELKQVIVEKNVDNTYQTIADLVAEKDAIANRLVGIPLHATDVLRIFSPASVPVEAQITNEYVRVAGEVKQTGVFKIKKGETLRELIARLGGPTENGYLYATKLTRDSVRKSQQEQLDEAAGRFERDIETNATQRIAGLTEQENITAVTAELERQRRLAQKLREVKAEGRIVLELQDASAQLKNLPDLELQNGDSVYIPRKPGTVDVLGAVFQQNAFIYRTHRTVSDYLALAGGPTVTADPSEIYLLRADGTTQSARSSGWFSSIGSAQVNPGDTVVVPEKLERSSLTQSVKEWTSILYQFGLGAAALKVLKN